MSDSQIYVLEKRIRKLTEQILWRDEVIKETRSELNKLKSFNRKFADDKVYVAFLQSEMSDLESQYNKLQHNFLALNKHCTKWKELTEHFDYMDFK